MRWRWTIAAVVALAGALAVPFVSAEPMSRHLKRSIEMALGRPVKIEGTTHFRLLPVPALIADQVIIGEDPAYSLEPFAYVGQLEVQPRFLSLARGRLEASRIRLIEPSVNVMRGPAGWNVQSLVSKRVNLPVIEVRNGRLNFKQGDAKSAFYLMNTLVDIGTPTAQGDLDIFLSAEPARTDRGTQGFGQFSLRGQLHSLGAAEPKLDLDVELQPSAIHAFNFFFGARGSDFAGKFSGKGHLEGPWSAARLEGGLQFEGLEPQSFLRLAGRSNTVAFEGQLNLPGERLTLNTVGGEALRVRMRARDFFHQAKGAMLVEARQVDLGKLLELGREANAKLPAGARFNGTFNGVVGYSWPSAEEVPAKGMIWFEDSSLELPDQPALVLPDARAVVEGSRWLLASTRVNIGESQSAVMDADWNARNGALSVRVATQLLSVRGLKNGLGLLLRASNLPLLAAAQGGSWQGNLHYRRAEDADPGTWSGKLIVRNMALDLPGVKGPLEISSAHIVFDPNRVAVQRMRAAWDGIELEGDYVYHPDSRRPSEFNLVVPEASAVDLEALLHDAQRPPSGLLEKIRLKRSNMPEWLRARNLSGNLRFKNLHFAGGSFHPLLLKVQWLGEEVEAAIRQAEFSPSDGAGAAHAIQLHGVLKTALWRQAVDYEFQGQIASWPIEKGTATFAGKLKTSGLGENWVDTLDGEGTLRLSSGDDVPRLTIRQGKLEVDYLESKKKPLALPGPYWPLALATEP